MQVARQFLDLHDQSWIPYDVGRSQKETHLPSILGVCSREGNLLNGTLLAVSQLHPLLPNCSRKGTKWASTHVSHPLEIDSRFQNHFGGHWLIKSIQEASPARFTYPRGAGLDLDLLTAKAVLFETSENEAILWRFRGALFKETYIYIIGWGRKREMHIDVDRGESSDTNGEHCIIATRNSNLNGNRYLPNCLEKTGSFRSQPSSTKGLSP